MRGVLFDDGRELEADLVVMAAGIRPNIELAHAAGLRCDRGVLVNDTMQTFDPSIYAVGECVQHRNSTYGLVAPLFDQASVCATHLAEFGIGHYSGSLVSTQLKVTGIDLFSAGDFVGGPRSEALVLRDAQARHLQAHRDREQQGARRRAVWRCERRAVVFRADDAGPRRRTAARQAAVRRGVREP